MHRALEITEIISLIVSNFDTASYNSWLHTSTTNPRPTLAALARCRIFHEEAVGMLWAQQNTLGNLMRCLAVSGLWNRVKYYARYVKELTVDLFAADVLKFIIELIRHTVAPGDYLLPNLQSLSWMASTRKNFPDIDLFLAPRLTSIQLVFPGFDEQYLAVLRTISNSRSNLTSIQISFHKEDPLSPNIQSSFSNFVCCFQSLNSPILHTAIDAESIIHLGRIPSLERLVLSPADSSSLAQLPESELFPNLRVQFGCTGQSHNLEYLTGLARSWAQSPLRWFDVDIRIALDTPPPSSSFEELFCALSEHCSHEAFRELSLCISVHPHPALDPTTCLAFGRVLAPLLPFFALEDVYIIFPDGYRSNDEDILALASSWPKLKRLLLVGHDELQPCEATLNSLLSLAKYCPDLDTLILNFDATSIPALDGEIVIQSALKVLNVECCLIRNAEEVARFISSLFPKVSEFGDLMDEDDIEDLEDRGAGFLAQLECHKLWKEVKEILTGR
ncbi:hypothetical protein R3P38DRAFT_420504 [Favolaschia claudopus]|uniref:Uncharacterized protein n=1 Tax=Favolaschia claudopus TaxID=2862362 RepID=A0AAW0CN49_9AGAR